MRKMLYKLDPSVIAILAIVIASLLILCTVGCAPSAQLYGQQITPYRAGVVKYEITRFEKESHIDAMKKAMEFCQGKVEVEQEIEKHEFVGYNVHQDHHARLKYRMPIYLDFRYLFFRCGE